MSEKLTTVSYDDELPTVIPTAERKDQIEQLNQMFYDDTDQNLEQSPKIDSPLARAKRRVADYLQDNIIDRLHDSADKNDASAKQDAIFASYDENVQFTKNRERNERIDNAKQVLSSIGYAALGVGIMGAEATTRSIKNTSDTIAEGARNKIEGAKSGAATFQDATLRRMDNAYFATKDTITEGVDSVKSSAADKISSVKNFFTEKRDAALARKANRAQIREDKWAEVVRQSDEAQETAVAMRRAANVNKLARQEKRAEFVTSTKESSAELWEKAQNKRRAIGGKALSLFARARATGYAAAETWQQHDTQDKL